VGRAGVAFGGSGPFWIMTQEAGISDWLKVKLAAVLGIGSPWLLSLVDKFGPVLDVIIKLGQVGVAAITIIYIFTKWRKLRKKKDQKQ